MSDRKLTSRYIIAQYYRYGLINILKQYHNYHIDNIAIAAENGHISVSDRLKHFGVTFNNVANAMCRAIANVHVLEWFESSDFGITCSENAINAAAAG